MSELLLVAFGIAALISAGAYPLYNRPYRRASKGLDLISGSHLPPSVKIELLMLWRDPAVSSSRYAWLERTIADLEAKSDEAKR
ncbi:hypothetical protein [Mycolicibacterium neoaurum]|uniref:hypothetical protein n=1 Tax=Mycolicibacterium neoaurum TaxID=1795 RepID=UPI001F4CFA1F|nr:hypothetical protein [Mycolicibacterium neoaurum]